MRYPSGHKTNSTGGAANHRSRSGLSASGWHWRFASADTDNHGQDARATRQGSGFRARDSGFRIHPSSFILHPSRSGVTLVEMLIVISIIAILTVASLKLMAPADERRVREAARAVNVYISSARNQAIEIGRPCGVIFRRANGTNFPTATTVLDQCEVPPTYAGDVSGAVVKAQDNTTVPATPLIKLKIRPNDFASNLIRPGDLIQLNNQGVFYEILPPHNPVNPDEIPLDANGIYFQFPTAVATDVDGFISSQFLYVTFYPLKTPSQALPWPSQASGLWSTPVPFLIMRQPVKSSAAPLQLPAGSVVDLDFSGTDYQTFQNPPGNFYDVAIIFSPNGSVEGYYWNNQPYPALGPIFMLIGSRSRVRDFVAQPFSTNNPNLNDLPNWADLSSVWITINYQTGMSASDENFAINPAQQDLGGITINWTIAPNWNWTNTSNWPFFIKLSRNYARQSQSMGGR